MDMREEDAIFVGKYKLGYRGCRNGTMGLVYIKGDDCIFKTCEELIQEIHSGPYRVIDDNTENKNES